MAYNIIYTYQYYDLNNVLNKIDILELDYSGGSTQIEKAATEPISIQYRGEKDKLGKIILGQELKFTFYVARADVPTYDALFEGLYKEYKVKYYVGAQLEFEGYVKPENLEKEYSKNPPYIEISLSATDALVDLKNINFGDGEIINDKLTILEIIKRALTPIGIELDFYIQLGTYEKTHMTSIQCALDKIQLDTRRFLKQDGDKTEILSCYQVIETVLKDFNVKFRQYKGRYQVTNYHELNSYEFVFDWSTLTQQSRTATSNIIDITSYKAIIKGSSIVGQQKIRPLNSIGITFQNKDLGGDVTGMDLDDWSNASIWTIDFSNSYSVASGVVTLKSNDNTYDEYIETANFNVSKVTEDDYLKITFDHILDTYTSSDPLKSPTIKIKITHPDLTVEESAFAIKENWESYESSIFKTFKVSATGNYKVRLSFKQVAGPSQWTTAEFKIKKFQISKVIVLPEGGDTTNIVFDEYYKQTSDKGIELFEVITLVGDAGQITEVGAFLYDDSGTWKITEDWNSYNHTEGIKIFDIYARNILNNRYEYKSYLRATFIDRAYNVGFNNIITISSKNYVFLTYERLFRTGVVTAELVELLTTYQSYSNIIRSRLDSINGERAISSVNVNPVSPSNLPPHGELEGLSADDHAQYALLTGRTGDVYKVDDLTEFTVDHGIDIEGVHLENYILKAKELHAYYTSDINKTVKIYTEYNVQHWGRIIAYDFGGPNYLDLAFQNLNAGDPDMVIKASTGYVGIQTGTPGSEFDVDGTITCRSAVNVDTVNEYIVDAGVTIEGSLHKDYIITINQSSGGYLDFGGTIDIRDNTVKIISYSDPSVHTIRIGEGAGNGTMTTAHAILVGNNAGNDLTSGTYPIFIGRDAGALIQDGIYNMAIGYQSLTQNVSGDRQMALGVNCLQYNIGTENTAIGHFAMRYQYNSSNNVAVGSYAMNGVSASDNAANYNIAVGRTSLYEITEGDYNLAIGYQSGYHVSIGHHNTLIGAKTGFDLYTGYYNILIGYNVQPTASDSIYELKIGATTTYILEGSVTPSSEWIGSAYEARFDDIVEYTIDTGILIEGSLHKDYIITIDRSSGGYLTFNTDIDIRAGINKRIIYDETLHNWRIGENAGNDSMTGSNNYIWTRNGGDALTSGGFNVLIGVFSGGSIEGGSHNIAIGRETLESGVSINYNIAIGSYALEQYNNIEAIAIGYKAGRYSTGLYGMFIGSYAGQGASGTNIGDYNTFLGYSAGKDIGSGDYNFGFGYSSLTKLQTGSYNVAVGSNSFLNTISGANNIGIGSDAGMYFISGDHNLFIGYSTGRGIVGTSTGSYNIFVGSYAGDNITTGSYNLIIGYNINVPIATADNQFIIGKVGVHLLEGNMTAASEWIGSAYEARFDDIVEYTTDAGVTVNGLLIEYNTVYDNLLLATSAGSDLTTGDHNVFIGKDAGDGGADKSWNIAIGAYSLAGVVTPQNHCVAIGYYTLYNNTAHNNIAIGSWAMQSTTNSASNVGIGESALRYLYTGSDYNLAVGGDAGKGAVTPTAVSTANVFLGMQSGLVHNGALHNVGLGYDTLSALIGGDYNMIMGSSAGNQITSGSYNILIGYNVDTTSATTSYELRIGHDSVFLIEGNMTSGSEWWGSSGYRLSVICDEASKYAGYFFNDGNNINRYGIKIQSGTDDQASNVNKCLSYFDGNGDEQGGLENNSGTFQLYQGSDRRLKTDIVDTEINATKILNLLTVRDYRFKGKLEVGKLHTGWIAQEINEIFPRMADYKKESDLWTVSPTTLIPILNKGFQEHDKEIKDLKVEVKELKETIKKLAA